MDSLLFSAIAFVVGLIFGSFANMLVWRLYAMESFGGRSRCTSCRRVLLWRDLIPLLSYWLLGRECRFCHKPISGVYPFVEFVSGMGFALVTAHLADVYGAAGLVSGIGLPHYAFALFAAMTLVLVIASDTRFSLIFDILLLPAIPIAFVWKLFLGGSALTMLGGALAGLAFFGLQYVVSRGRWIGFGDVKLGAFLGVVFGAYQMLFVVALAYVMGSVVSVWLMFRGEKKLTSTLPLGLFLGLAALYILAVGVRPIERLLRI